MPTLQRPQPLSQPEKDEWFDNHLPYRLRVLMSWPKRIAQCDAEASLIHCRLFLQFLGLGIAHNPLTLINKRNYFDVGPVDEIKINDLNGSFVDANTLSPGDADLAARAYHAASKASAHLTFKSAHGFDPAELPRACNLALKLVKVKLYDIVGRPLPEIDFAKLKIEGC
jgi:hypothetical protein